MDLVGKILEKALDKSGDHSSSSGGGAASYGGYPEQPSAGYGSSGPPQDLPYPWVARWDDRDQRWFFVNEQTGQSSWTHPGQGYAGGAQPPSSYGQPYGQQPSYGYDGSRTGDYYPDQQPPPAQKDNSKLYAAGGVAAGLAVGAIGGAVLMHEGEEIHDDFEQDKARFEQGVEDFPQDAAQWTGEKVGEVEQIPDNIEQGWDRAEDRVENEWDGAVQDVENAPQEAAGWVGEQVGEVEQFGDDVEQYGDSLENAYDQGEAEGRNDDGGW
ncbi:hypothetical protein FE257_012743 [Aspergillus nanangensis]|uniref:WW domain-containing protein n=1 Tax=Aspergillus nanangensis TaxID=2582783 RepID=A0AAD4CG35_ASPNN|nr:hypothetical protein FE257_012743 [Aspergillus nanangensis]